MGCIRKLLCDGKERFRCCAMGRLTGGDTHDGVVLVTDDDQDRMNQVYPFDLYIVAIKLE